MNESQEFINKIFVPGKLGTTQYLNTVFLTHVHPTIINVTNYVLSCLKSSFPWLSFVHID